VDALGLQGTSTIESPRTSGVYRVKSPSFQHLAYFPPGLEPV